MIIDIRPGNMKAKYLDAVVNFGLRTQGQRIPQTEVNSRKLLYQNLEGFHKHTRDEIGIILTRRKIASSPH